MRVFEVNNTMCFECRWIPCSDLPSITYFYYYLFYLFMYLFNISINFVVWCCCCCYQPQEQTFFKNSVHPWTICGDIYGAIWWVPLLQCISGLVSGCLCKGKVWIRGAGQIKWNEGAFYISRIVWKQGDQQARSPGLPDEMWAGAWEGEVVIAGRWDFSVGNWEAFH